LKATVHGRLGAGWQPPPLVTLTRGGWLGAGVGDGVGPGVGLGVATGEGTGVAATGGAGNVGPPPSQEERRAAEPSSAAAHARDVMSPSWPPDRGARQGATTVPGGRGCKPLNGNARARAPARASHACVAEVRERIRAKLTRLTRDVAFPGVRVAFRRRIAMPTPQ
jgi:hypothetical protein